MTGVRILMSDGRAVSQVHAIEVDGGTKITRCGVLAKLLRLPPRGR